MVNFSSTAVFAWVLAIVIMLMGRSPSRRCPSRSIRASPACHRHFSDLSGASADDVQSTVTQVIEQQMSGATTCFTSVPKAMPPVP